MNNSKGDPHGIPDGRGMTWTLLRSPRYRANSDTQGTERREKTLSLGRADNVKVFSNPRATALFQERLGVSQDVLLGNFCVCLRGYNGYKKLNENTNKTSLTIESSSI